MGVNDTEKNGKTKKRMSLANSKQVRATLCKLARQYYNGEIPDTKIRNLVYNCNSILAADKFINVETELTAKFENLIKLVDGAGGTVIDPKELDSPYTQELKKQLAGEQQEKAELWDKFLELKRELAAYRAEYNGSGE